MNINKAAQQLGKLGGQSTAKKHGSKYLSEIGKKGAQIKKDKAKTKCAIDEMFNNPLKEVDRLVKEAKRITNLYKQ